MVNPRHRWRLQHPQEGVLLTRLVLLDMHRAAPALSVLAELLEGVGASSVGAERAEAGALVADHQPRTQRRLRSLVLPRAVEHARVGMLRLEEWLAIGVQLWVEGVVLDVPVVSTHPRRLAPQLQRDDLLHPASKRGGDEGERERSAAMTPKVSRAVGDRKRRKKNTVLKGPNHFCCRETCSLATGTRAAHGLLVAHVAEHSDHWYAWRWQERDRSDAPRASPVDATR